MQETATATEARISALTDAAKTAVVKHIARRADEVAERAGAAQVRALEAAARTLFRAELEPALQRLTEITRHARNTTLWWNCTAAAGLSSVVTCFATLYWLSP